MPILKIKNWIFGHKKTSALGIIILGLVIYWSYGKIFAGTAETKYVIAAVEKSTIVSSVTGSGQVSASNQVDLKSNVAGSVVYIGTQVGDRVPAGTIIAQIDSEDAAIALENAQIALKKLTKIDPLVVTQAENALTDAVVSNKKAYDDGFSNVTSAFVDLTSILSGLDSLVNGVGGSGFLNDQKYLANETERGYMSRLQSSYYGAKNSYDKTNALYKTITRNSSESDIRSLVSSVYDVSKKVSQAIKDGQSATLYIKNEYGNTSEASSAQTSLDGWLSEINTDLQSLSSSLNTIDSSTRTVAEKKATLTDVKSGADPLDVRSQELAVRQKQSAYADSFIRAPFAGVLASLEINQGDELSSGTTVGVFITENKVANISLNEVDVAKVKVGQKATLTFDAIDGLSITGKVIQVDLVGTVSQGVVSYNVKIGFDTQDDRVKSGMSTSVSIITDVRQDVVIVPSSAIKTQNGTSYVLLVDKGEAVSSSTQGSLLNTLPTDQTVEVGISDDTSTEIISGLNEGDKIVTKTITSAITAKSTAPSILSATGANRSATGGAARAFGR